MLELRYEGPGPGPRQAADVHERLRRRRAQAARPASARRWATCSSSPTTSRCRSASSGSARAAAHGGHNGLRSVIDELGTEKFSRLRVGIGDAGRGAPSTTCSRRSSPTSASGCRPCSTPPPTRSRSGPATGRRRRPTASTASSSRPADETPRSAPTGRGRRAARRARGSAGRRRAGGRSSRARGDEARPSGDERPVPRPDDPPAERRREVARDWAERRAAASRRAGAGPREGVGRRRGRAARSGSQASAGGADARPSRPRRPAAPGRRTAPGHRPRRRPSRAGPRGPPALLHDTGAFGCLRERLGDAGRRPAAGRHVGLTSVPHGAKSFLAATLALRRDGERICWIARDAEIGDRVAEELAAWLGDPAAVAMLEPRTALAYERSELVADETAARVAALAAWRSGRRRASSSPASRRWSSTRSRRTTCRPSRGASRVGARLAPGRAAPRAARVRLHADDRGRRPRRVRPPRRHRRRLPAVGAAAGPDRVLRRRDRLAARLRPDGPAHASARSSEVVLLPASEFLAAARRSGRAPRAARPGRGEAPRAARRGPRPVRAATRRRGATGRRSDPRRWPSATPPRSGPPILAPSTGFDHLDPSTLLVLDEPGEIAEAAEFLWRQADERRAELIEAGDLPKDWPSTYLGPRDWKSRLARRRGRSSSPGSPSCRPRQAFAARGLSSGDLFGWREPQLPPGRARPRSPRRSSAGRQDGARIVLASDQAPRLAELLDEAGHPTASSTRRTPPPPGAIALVERSLNGGFEGGPDGLAFVTDRELFGTVRVRRPKAMRRVVPRDILERLTPGDLVVHIDHGVARYERMLRRGKHGRRGPRLPRAELRGRRQDLRPGRADHRVSPATRAASTRRSASSAAPSGCGRSSASARRSPTSRRSCSSCTRPARNTRATPTATTRRGRPRWRRASRTRRRPTSCARRPRSSSTWRRGRPMDRLVVGDVGYGKTEVALRAAFKAIAGRQAGRGPRADDRPRGAAPPDLRPALRRVPADGRGCCRGSSPQTDQKTTLTGLADGIGRPRDRHPPAPVARTSRSATSASSSSTRSSGSASRPRSG